MSRTMLTAAVLVITGIGLNLAAAPIAGKKATPKVDPGSAAVEKVLRAEVAGQVDRREQLAGALQDIADSPSVRWQAGFVRNSSSWKSFDDPAPAAPGNEILTEYETRRREAPQTFAGQLELANWCRKRGLVDQERAHLFASQAAPPCQPDPAVLERLGYMQLGTQWLSPEQMLDWQKLNRQAELSLKKWETRLERITERLAGGQGQRTAALRELQKIDDPLAVPAIEYVLAGRDDETAKLAVVTLRQISGPEASLALAKQGVFSQWPSVRKSASAALKARKLDDFVPALLNLLVTPGQTGFTIYQDPSRGGLSCSYAMAVETGDAVQFHVSTLHIMIPVIEVQVGAGTGGRGTNLAARPTQSALGSQLARAALDEAGHLAREQVFNQETASAAVNDRIRELNDRIVAVLADVSGKEPSPDPRAWWKWWQAESDSQSLYEKQVVVVSEESETTTTPIISSRSVDCLAAGTLVRTDRGLAAIETIRIGDRVLSQEVETGELAFKPVLQTTVRPPKELWTVRFNDETVVTTGGHRFWSSGHGWVKSRELESQALLHTVTGNTPVWTAKKGETAQTYNLVVADFHTYFVGKTGILSQDVLTPHGTNSLVPGLARMNAVAEAGKK